MRIVVGLNYYTPYVSGLTNVARDTAEGLAKLGHDLTVVTAQHDPSLPLREEVNGVTVIRAPVRLRFGKGVIAPGLVAGILDAARDADIVNLHAPMLEAGLIARKIKRTTSARVALTYHCDVSLPPSIVNTVQRAAIDASSRAAAAASDIVLVQTEDYAMHSRVSASLTPRSAVAVPCWDRSGGRPAFRTSNGLHVGFLGRVVEEKGIEFLVEGFSRIPDPDARLIIAGEFATVAGGSVIDRVRTAIGDDSRVQVLGFLDDADVPDFYASLDVFALTSINAFEAFGIVQVEAMMAGVPALVSDLPGVRVPVGETGFGRIVEPRNSSSIAEALTEWSAPMDPVVGARRAAERYGAAIVIRRYERAFEDLLAPGLPTVISE